LWWHQPVILALRRERQEDHEFKVQLSYMANLVSSLSLSKEKKILLGNFRKHFLIFKVGYVSNTYIISN
jgi:hypothetical protein